jgi:UDP-2,4-diacetamido-2,4,6-trideoxy-beta-L-altropyranose hydrolase
MTAKVAVFRADASETIGAGHIVRTLALLSVVRNLGIHCILATRTESLPYVSTLSDQNIDILELQGTPDSEPAQLKNHLPEGCQWLSVDHYNRGEDFERACHGWAEKILALDDDPARFHSSALLTDPTPKDSELPYRKFVGPDCALLTGPSYALLRPEFLAARNRRNSQDQSSRPSLRRIFISMGGSDPLQATSTILGAIEHLDQSFEIDVVTAMQPQAECENLTAVALGASTVTFHSNLRTTAHLMEKADLSIGAGGSTSWERCCMGLPSIVVITAENQIPVAKYLEDAGALKIAGTADDIKAAQVSELINEFATDPSQLAEMGDKAWQICDGRGCERVASVMFPAKSIRGPVTLRPANLSDGDQILCWQTAPDARKYFRTPDVPTREQHMEWMSKKLGDPNCLLNIVETTDTTCGILRLDRIPESENSYEVSILIGQDFQGSGIGRAALEQAKFLISGSALVAEVDPANTPSQGLFLAAGFTTQDGRNFSTEPLISHE